MVTKALVFDFGGVLMDWSPRYLYRQFFNGDLQATDNFLAEIGFNEWNLEFDRGRPFEKGIGELKGRFPQYRELIEVFDQRWDETLAGPIVETVEILRALKKSGYPLYGLSNWSAEKFAGVRKRYDFFEWFDAIVLSGEVKLVKPDPRIFELLLAKADRRAPECLFIDDSVQNVTVARTLGFDTILFQSPQQFQTELNQKGICI